MSDVCIPIFVGIACTVIGYLLSWRQNRKLIGAAIRILRPFEAVSLRDEFYMTQILATRIRNERFDPDAIVAITPGGAMIGEWLSRRFLAKENKPKPLCTLWMHIERDRCGKHISAPKTCTYSPSFPETKEIRNVLVVNDITRSGRTLELAITSAKSMFNGAHVKAGVLFLSQDAAPPYPDFWVDKPPRRVLFEWKGYSAYPRTREKAGDLVQHLG